VSALAPSGSTRIRREYAIIQRGMARVGPTPHLFEAERYAPEAVRLVRDRWSGQLADEHRSTFVFSALAGQMAEAGAGVDMVAVMLRMAQDELRHTATCASVIRALGGNAEPEADFTVEQLATHRGVSPEERALRNVIYTTSCSELVACARFVATLDETTDPYMRQMMRTLLADEILHAQFGFHYLEAWRPWLEAHPETVVSLERFLRHAFAVIERELAPAPPFPSIDAETRALGGDDPALAREVFYGTMESATVPGLARFGIDAERCWKTRSLASG